ncbi:hypothetical protein T484DRAFT_1779972 [Baffinella frigidus]|nr:hypothetical protein T484DRAFT_1779972 [Cryptophyta sp. CCMP2293]
MKKPSESKAMVSEYEAEKNAASAAREKHDALYVSKQAAQVVINELRDQHDALYVTKQAAQKSLYVTKQAAQVGINELRDQGGGGRFFPLRESPQ